MSNHTIVLFDIDGTLVTGPDDLVRSLTLYDDGAHGDGAANDMIYGASAVMAMTPTYYQIDIYAADSLGNEGVYSGLGGAATVPSSLTGPNSSRRPTRPSSAFSRPASRPTSPRT